MSGQEKNRLEQFREYSIRNEWKNMDLNHLGIKRFFNPDTNALNVALVVGGSIVIPHLRHTVSTLAILEQEGTLS